jgi:glutathione-specific gamma-glutamylcyclotransferase
MGKVDRSFLERDGVRNAVRESGHGHLLMPDEAVAHSLAQTMAQHRKGQPVWIFGYGSLVWNPLLEFAERQPAHVHGYHRGFYVWSKVNRGTPDLPGLVLGLDGGGSCHGVAYRLHREGYESELAILWRREMVAGTYRPRWVNARTDSGTVRAIAFVVNRAAPGYTGKLSDERIVAIASRASGHYGSCADYLIQTATSLEAHGIADSRLSRLAAQVARRTPAKTP